jgi:hypothetical protein
MADNKEDTDLTDRQLHQLLKFASQPKPNADFEMRLMQRIEADVTSANIVAFPQRQHFPFWLAGLPLAASLLIGIWFGANDTLSGLLPFGNQDMSLNVAGLFYSGEDIDNLTEDTQS